MPEMNEATNHAEADALLDQLLDEDKKVKKARRRQIESSDEDEGDGCCKPGGGCGPPKLTKADKKRLEAARQQYRDQKEKDELENPPMGPVAKFFYSMLKMVAILSIGIAFLYLKSGAEKYAQDRSVGDHVDSNPYQTLGIKPSAPTREIRKAYRNLSLQWHPDRNPGCTTMCEDKMEHINFAYSILSNKEKKKAYDNAGVHIDTDSIESIYSLELNDSNYDGAMAAMYDSTLPVTPILVQVYDPTDPVSTAFGRIWDHTAESISHMNLSFVRINNATHPHLTRKLPVRPGLMPSVLILERNKPTQILPGYKARDPKLFKTWIEDNIGPDNMVPSAKNKSQLSDWVNASCGADYFSSGLPIPDDRARIIVVTQSGRPKPSAVVKRVALQFHSVADILYASPSAIPNEWRTEVDVHRNSLILLPRCSHNEDRDQDSSLVLPQKVMAFGKTSFNDFYTYTSYLLTHRAMPLTRQTADALCSSTVMGTPRRTCMIQMINESETMKQDVSEFESFANRSVLPTREFKELYNQAKEGNGKVDDDDEEEEEATTTVNFQSPMVQHVYVFGPGEGHKESCKCPTSQMFKLMSKGGSTKNSLLLDLTGGYVLPCERGVKVTAKLIEDGVLPFSADSDMKCLTSNQSFLNKCLVPGEVTEFMKVLHFAQKLSAIEWMFMSAVFTAVCLLATGMNGAQWAMVLFISPLLIQAWMFLSPFLNKTPSFDYFDEL